MQGAVAPQDPAMVQANEDVMSRPSTSGSGAFLPNRWGMTSRWVKERLHHGALLQLPNMGIRIGLIQFECNKNKQNLTL